MSTASALSFAASALAASAAAMALLGLPPAFAAAASLLAAASGVASGVAGGKARRPPRQESSVAVAPQPAAPPAPAVPEPAVPEPCVPEPAPRFEALRAETSARIRAAQRRLTFADAILRKVPVKTEEAAFALMQRLVALREQSEKAARSASSTGNQAQDSDEIARLAAGARDTIGRVRGALTEMRKHDKDASGKLKTLGQELKSGIELLAGIEEITERSRLIAFNMAIEAARIGEKGRGFKVIVGELRDLNDRTIGFSKQVAEMLTNFRQYNETLVDTFITSSELVAREVERGIGDEELAIESLLSASTACVRLSDDVLDTVKRMNVELDGVLESLQFQDITRQMIEGALLTMDEARTEMAPLSPPEDGASFRAEEANKMEELRSQLIARSKTRGEKEAIQEVKR